MKTLSPTSANKRILVGVRTLWPGFYDPAVLILPPSHLGKHANEYLYNLLNLLDTWRIYMRIRSNAEPRLGVMSHG